MSAVQNMSMHRQLFLVCGLLALCFIPRYWIGERTIATKLSGVWERVDSNQSVYIACDSIDKLNAECILHLDMYANITTHILATKLIDGNHLCWGQINASSTLHLHLYEDILYIVTITTDSNFAVHTGNVNEVVLRRSKEIFDNKDERKEEIDETLWLDVAKQKAPFIVAIILLLLLSRMLHGTTAQKRKSSNLRTEQWQQFRRRKAKRS